MTTGKFISRGFLRGPWCPIYGLWIVIVTFVSWFCDPYFTFESNDRFYTGKEEFRMIDQDVRYRGLFKRS